MKGKNKQVWIEQGYQMVSETDFAQVNVESIARCLNKNKSSFYYYFGDWSVFEAALLAHHEELAIPFSKKLSQCQNIIPDILKVFIDHKTDIFFHKQLRIHREKPHFKKCIASVFERFENSIHDQWTAFLKLEQQPFLATKILALLSDNFLLQITHETYTYSWLKQYMLEASRLMQDMHAPPKKD